MAFLAVLIAVLLLVARASDGPIGPLPGGALEIGERAAVDQFVPPLVREGRWELETNGRSRTVAMFLVAQRRFALRPAIATPYGWSQDALGPHDAALRIDGKIFEV